MRRLMWCFALAVTATTPMVSAIAHAGETIQRDRDPKFDPGAVTSVLGTILDVRETTTQGSLPGVHVVIKADKRTIEAYLGPAAFLNSFELKFVKGDEIKVTGSKVKFAGSDLLLASQLRKNNDILVLRDPAGKPYWDDENFKLNSSREGSEPPKAK